MNVRVTWLTSLTIGIASLFVAPHPASAQSVSLSFCQSAVGAVSAPFVNGCSCSGTTLVASFALTADETFPNSSACSGAGGQSITDELINGTVTDTIPDGPVLDEDGELDFGFGGEDDEDDGLSLTDEQIDAVRSQIASLERELASINSQRGALLDQRGDITSEFSANYGTPLSQQEALVSDQTRELADAREELDGVLEAEDRRDFLEDQIATRSDPDNREGLSPEELAEIDAIIEDAKSDLEIIEEVLRNSIPSSQLRDFVSVRESRLRDERATLADLRQRAEAPREEMQRELASIDSEIDLLTDAERAIYSELSRLEGLLGDFQVAVDDDIPRLIRNLTLEDLDVFVRAGFSGYSDTQDTRDNKGLSFAANGGATTQLSERHTAGILFGVNHAGTDDETAADRDTESWGGTFGLIGAYRMARSFAFDGALVYGLTYTESERSGGITGDYFSNTLAVSVGANYLRAVSERGQLNARLGYLHSRTRSGEYGESDGTSNASAVTGSGDIMLTGRYLHRYDKELSLFGELTAQYDVVTEDPQIDRFDVNPAFGASMMLGPDMLLSVQGNVGGLFRNNYLSYGATADLSFRF